MNTASAPPPVPADPLLRHNLCVESLFSAFNGVFLGLALFAAPVVAVVGLEASPLDVTILATAFPIGSFLGPLWVWVGRRWSMKTLVLGTSLVANVPFLLVFWVDSPVAFTALITVSQLMNSAMRMGQSSLYRVVYPQATRGRVLGVLTFWTYVTMVPSVLLCGWLLDKSREMYQIVYPLGGICGLIGCFYFSLLRVPGAEAVPVARPTFRGGVENVERILQQDRLYLLFQVSFFLSGAAFFMSSHVVLLLARATFDFSAFELSLCLSVLPQLLLALGSPSWGAVLDRIGIVRTRVLISTVLTACLASYWFGLVTGLAWLMYLGSVLQGVGNAGGQLTWFLASSLFAPRAEDVPSYNGIHFVSNGARGLLLPWVGSILLVTTGSGAVLAAALVSLASVPVLFRALALKDSRLEMKPLRLLPRAAGGSQ